MPVVSRHTEISPFPSPSQSPGVMKSSLARPNCWKVNPPPDLEIYQTLLEGRKTEKSALPSPSKSTAVRSFACGKAGIARKVHTAARTIALPLLNKKLFMFIILYFGLTPPAERAKNLEYTIPGR